MNSYVNRELVKFAVTLYDKWKLSCQWWKTCKNARGKALWWQIFLNLFRKWTLFEPNEQKVSKVVLSGDSQIIQESWYTLYMMHWNCDAWHRGFNNFHPAGQYVEWGGKTHLIEGLFYRQFCSGNFNRDCSYSS